jgi:hypothetical protein
MQYAILMFYFVIHRKIKSIIQRRAKTCVTINNAHPNCQVTRPHFIPFSGWRRLAHRHRESKMCALAFENVCLAAVAWLPPAQNNNDTHNHMRQPGWVYHRSQRSLVDARTPYCQSSTNLCASTGVVVILE